VLAATVVEVASRLLVERMYEQPAFHSVPRNPLDRVEVLA
jgi:hypothetical protein